MALEGATYATLPIGSDVAQGRGYFIESVEHHPELRKAAIPLNQPSATWR